jgi:hypothetical protein
LETLLQEFWKRVLHGILEKGPKRNFGDRITRNFGKTHTRNFGNTLESILETLIKGIWKRLLHGILETKKAVRQIDPEG